MPAPFLLAAMLATSTFVCAALMFWIEPLVGKQLLPLAGGAPAVWNVCLLFFQTALLAGYAFAHAVTRLRRPGLQVILYLSLVGSALLTWPIQFDTPLPQAEPSFWLLGQLLSELGLFFVALSAASPLLQRWFAAAMPGRDPYRLYAASNAGSLLALLAYPTVIEPALAVVQQQRVWIAVYFAALGTLAVSGWLTVRSWSGTGQLADELAHAPDFKTQLHWLVLACLPSSLLLGVTSYLTTDLAPIPLLWVLPLALYLASFILAFGFAASGPGRWLVHLVILFAVVWSAVYRVRATEPLWLMLAIHLLTFVLVALVCHSRLAALRPVPAYLTRFYLLIGLGGALGGAFNALIAPVLFDSYAEYPIAMLCAVLLGLSYRFRWSDLPRDLVPAALLLVAALLVLTIDSVERNRAAVVILTVALPAIVVLALSKKPGRFVLGLAAFLLVGLYDPFLVNHPIHAERNFFGVLQVTNSRGRFNELRHGSTLHGVADVTTRGGSPPLSYYSHRSPIADALRGVRERAGSLRVGGIGLGVGSLAWYARPQDEWTFYEINPAVARIARDPEWFGFLRRSKAGSLRIILGDARLSLEQAPDGSFDLLVVDAFTSDAIPLHLLTREALQLYLIKLRPNGVIAFHVSNRYLDLTPVITELGQSLGLRVRARSDLLVPREENAKGIIASAWVALARNDDDFGAALFENTWYIPRAGGGRVWTDDYSGLWQALNW